MDQGRATRAATRPGRRKGRRQAQQQENDSAGETAGPGHRLLLVRGILLIEIADGLQALIKALHLGFVLRTENAVARVR